MITLTRLLNYILEIFTVFPGIFFVFEKNLPGIKKVKSNGQYAISIVAVSLLDAVFFGEIKEAVVLITVLIIPYFIEFLLNEIKHFSWQKLKHECRKLMLPYFVMVLCPVCEEIIYRYYIWKFIRQSTNQLWVYFLVSVFAFVFCHFMVQKLKSLYKIPLAIIQCALFAMYQNVFICIAVHMTFNVMTYMHNLEAHRQKWR